MEQPCSYAWRGTRGVGKRTKLLQFLEKQARKAGYDFTIKTGTWYLNKQSPAGGDPDEDDDEGGTGKSIPYEESVIHLGFDVARMSMSDKVFLQSVLTRWTGQNDVCLMGSTIKTRYLVLYHAHYLTDESVLQLQECLEQYSTFAVLLTTELPLCGRLRDFCMDIPVAPEDINESDLLLKNYTNAVKLPCKDVWMEFFKRAIDEWSSSWNNQRIADIRNWIYICLQRNLRWTDVIMYWIEAIYETPWISPSVRQKLLEILSEAESGSGWVLVTSYRIPILWEHVHLKLAKTMYESKNGPIVYIQSEPLFQKQEQGLIPSKPIPKQKVSPTNTTKSSKTTKVKKETKMDKAKADKAKAKSSKEIKETNGVMILNSVI